MWDKDKWDSLYEESDKLLKQAAIVREAAKLASGVREGYFDLIALEIRLHFKAKNLAAQLVPCTRCGVTPTIPCTARRSHAVRIKRAEWKGLIPDMAVHVHAANREYKGSAEVG